MIGQKDFYLDNRLLNEINRFNGESNDKETDKKCTAHRS